MLKSVRRLALQGLAGASLLMAVAGFQSGAEAMPDRDTRWRADLQELAQELPRRHTNLFFKVSRQEFERSVAALQNDIPSLADHEVAAELMRLGAMVGDAHTYVYPWDKGIFNRIALQLYWFRDGIYVTAADREHEETLGARLTAINGTPIDAVVERMKPYISYENDSRVKTTAGLLLVTPELLQHAGVIPSTARVELSVSRDGVTKEYSFDAKTRDERIDWVFALDHIASSVPLYLQNQRENYWQTYLPESGTLYVQYNTCREDADYSMSDFTRDVMAAADSLPVKRLVVDLRLNMGGSSYVAHPLMKAIAERPELNREGHLFVLVGRKTFSSAVLNTLQMQAQTSAIFVGEPTGGKPNHYGEVKEFTLPYSGYPVSYSTRYLAPAKADARSFVPDLVVEASSSDYLMGRDPVMEAVVGYSIASR